jgi:hypothetical protein
MEDFDNQYDKELIPNIVAELASFGKNPFKPTEPLEVDTLLKFTLYDENRNKNNFFTYICLIYYKIKN